MTDRELDRAVAEALGWHDFITPDAATYDILGPHYGVPPGMTLTRSSGYERIPHYSTDIAAAWSLVEVMISPDGPYAEQKWSFGLEYSSVVDFVASFDFTPRARHPKARDYPAFQAEAATMPQAICRAFLAARENTP